MGAAGQGGTSAPGCRTNVLTHGCLTWHLIFCNFGVTKGLWDLLSCLLPLALPMLCMVVQGIACRGLEPTAGGSTRDSSLARFPELPYGSRCLEFEPRAEPGVESSGWLCHPSNVPAKQGSAVRRNVILTGPASGQQLRAEQRGSCWTPWPAGDSLSAFLLTCLPRPLPPSWLEGRELRGCALRRCGCAFSSRARPHRGTPGSKGGALAPCGEEGVRSTPACTPALGDGGEPHLAAGCRSP